jgi:3-methyladenine DNA glycosylase/8-oxoguanine DNA glycosylase
MLALHGLGRLDVVPAGDLGYLELVGRLRGRRVDIPEVREFFADYAPWAGLAGEYLRLSRPRPARPLAGTRRSAGAPPRALA